MDPRALVEHAPFLRRLARSLLRDAAAAEDVVQESFLAAVRARVRPANLRAWLAAVVRRRSVDHVRSEHRRERRERARRWAGGPAEDVPRAVARLELQRQVVDAVLALPPAERDVVLHRFFYDRSYAEIASRLGLSPDGARTRVRRALDKLREQVPRASLGVLMLPARAAQGVVLMSAKKSLIVVATMLLLLAGLLWFQSRRRPDRSRGAGTNPAAPSAVPGADDRREAPAAAASDIAVVSGRCVDLAGGRPLSGAVVRSGSRRARTDEAGRFAFPWPAEGVPQLVAECEDYAPAPVPLPAKPASIDVGSVPMRRLWTANGIVVDADGAPVPGAAVRLREMSSRRRAWGGTVSDAQGAFSLRIPDDALRAGPAGNDGRIVVEAHRSGHLPAFREFLDPAQPLRIRLGRARLVSGTVLDKATGRPVGGARLSLSASARPEGRLVGVTAPDGTFRVGVHPPPRPGQITPNLDVRAEGYAPGRIRFDLLRDDGNRVELAPAIQVSGRVKDDRGRPRANLEVVVCRARHPEPPADPLARRFRLGNEKDPQFTIVPPGATVRTDAEGRFSAPLAKGEPFRISATAVPLKAVLEGAVPPAEEVELVLRPLDDYHQLLDVRVTDRAGRPLANAAVTWWAVPHAAGKGMGRSPDRGARTGPDGFARVWTNRTWTKPVRFYAWAPGWFGVSAEPVDRQALSDAAVVVCRPTGTLVGRIPPVAAGPRVRVSVWRKVGGEWPWRVAYVRVAADGSFVAPDVAPGRVRMLIAGPGGYTADRELDVAPGEVLDLGLVEVAAPSVIRGVVRDGNGDPVPAAILRWSLPEENAAPLFPKPPFLDSLRSAADGSFALPVPARRKVRVHATGGPFYALPGRKERMPMGRPVTVEIEPGATGIEIVVR